MRLSGYISPSRRMNGNPFGFAGFGHQYGAMLM